MFQQVEAQIDFGETFQDNRSTIILGILSCLNGWFQYRPGQKNIHMRQTWQRAMIKYLEKRMEVLKYELDWY